MDSLKTIKNVISCLNSEKYLVLNKLLYNEFKTELLAKVDSARRDSIQIVMARVSGYASGIRRKQKSYIRLYYLDRIVNELDITMTERVVQSVEKKLFKKQSNLNQYKEYGYVFEEKTAHLKKKELRKFNAALDVKYKIYVSKYFSLIERYNKFFESEPLRELSHSLCDY